MARILTITSWYPPHYFGGYELSCFDVMRRLLDRGHDVRVLCGDERLAGAAIPDTRHEQRVYRELRPHLWEASSRRPSLRERAGIERHNRLTLQRHLAEHRPDVVSVWHMRAVSLTLLRYLAERQIPVVNVVCDNWPVYAESVDAWTSLFARGALGSLAGRVVEFATGLPATAGEIGETGAYCFVSESTRQHAVAQKPWSYPLSTVVYSGINRDEFPTLLTPPIRSWGWRLLYVGRVDPFKGIETVLRALPQLPPQATLSCCGRGGTAERERLATIAEALGVADRVCFESLEREELAARYQAADVVIFPSEWPEPFGLVPVEAMACATPVIATGVGGSGEFLRDGYNSVLFPSGDATALAAAVNRLHADNELRRRVVFGGLRTAEQLDVDVLADVLEQWHVAAAERFVHGRPADRTLDLPGAARGDTHANGEVRPERTSEILTRLLEGVRGFVLDIGSGSALGHEARGGAGGSLVSVDPDWQAVRASSNAARKRGARVMGVAAHPEHLPFRTRIFDAIASDGSLQRATDDQAAVGELARVLRPAGLAVFTTSNRHDALAVRAELRDRLRGLKRPSRAYFHSSGHIREYSWKEFERLIRPTLRVRARRGVGWSRGWKSDIASTLVRVAPFRRFSNGIVVEAVRR
jgi:glycosyltransferase involved in cell wall biosynthesis/SAM-dependent methyltransferase